MSARYHNGNKTDETDNLLVFGYSCKLFRDDEKALFIDNGKHLIPWMGDDSLRIDRYDVRGILSDLGTAEVPSGGFERFSGLSHKEKQVEIMCDEERYRSLYSNEDEEALYFEEEKKRQDSKDSKTYGEVQFSYEETNHTEDTKESTPEDNEPFVPSPQLDIPLNMALPETTKHNAIIEKTALFIADQGPQMEILLKMKQSNNPQFNFLSFDNPLHGYYRLVLGAIKIGRYKPFETESKEEIEENDYLHPALLSSTKIESAPAIPTIQYKPSADCAYSMLVNKLKDKTKTALVEDVKKEDDKEAIKSEELQTPPQESVKTPSTISTIEQPPPNIQLIIDKMASYVSKNGRDFEQIVKNKKDQRFQFLEETHSYHNYYKYKLVYYEQLNSSAKQEKTDEILKQDSPQEKIKPKTAPVCFSIKPKEVEPPPIRPVKLVESSEEEEDETPNIETPEIIDKKVKEAKVEPPQVNEVKEKTPEIILPAEEICSEKLEKEDDVTCIDLTEDLSCDEIIFECKKPSEAVKLERKRRAALFIKKLKKKESDNELSLKDSSSESSEKSRKKSRKRHSESSSESSTSRSKSKKKHVKKHKRRKSVVRKKLSKRHKKSKRRRRSRSSGSDSASEDSSYC